MTFAEVTVKSGEKLSKRFIREFLRFSKFLNLGLCELVPFSDFYIRFLKGIHNEAKPLMDKTRKVADVFCGSINTFLGSRLGRLKPPHLTMELGLLVEQKFDFSVPFFVTHHEDLFSPCN
jgi:hypothetical protein